MLTHWMLHLSMMTLVIPGRLRPRRVQLVVQFRKITLSTIVVELLRFRVTASASNPPVDVKLQESNRNVPLVVEAANELETQLLVTVLLEATLKRQFVNVMLVVMELNRTTIGTVLAREVKDRFRNV